MTKTRLLIFGALFLLFVSAIPALAQAPADAATAAPKVDSGDTAFLLVFFRARCC